ncbi:MAG: TonB family protein [Bacteroidetes bacterium]|nr:MAG: TonB family protein [Bacteroidota bacterium]
MAQIIKADLDEMVFETRERSYGAYFLRKKYGRHLAIATGIIFFVFSSVVAVPRIMNELGLTEKEESVKAVKVQMSMEDLPPPPPIEEEKPPPPPPPKVPPPQVKTVAFKIPEPTPEEELDPEEEEQTIAEVEELKEAPNIGLEDKEGEDEGFFDGEIDSEGEIPEVIQAEPEPDINAFIFAEEEPKPINMGDIQKAIGYPQIARDAGIEGVVVVRVLVDELGNYSRHKVINQVHPILTKAVEEHVNKLKFTPAIQGGKPIKFWVNIPFNFKLLN